MCNRDHWETKPRISRIILMNENAMAPPAPTHVAVACELDGLQKLVRISHTGWGSRPHWAEARAWHKRPILRRRINSRRTGNAENKSGYTVDSRIGADGFR